MIWIGLAAWHVEEWQDLIPTTAMRMRMRMVRRMMMIDEDDDDDDQKYEVLVLKVLV